MEVTINPESIQLPSPPSLVLEVELVKCDSCGFTEECTSAYISLTRGRYSGRWICGLCVEAVKDEVLRSDNVITTEEALNRHISFCESFRSSSPPAKGAEYPIFAMGKIMRRSLNSPRCHRSNPSSPSRDIITSPALVRSGSCFSSLSS